MRRFSSYGPVDTDQHYYVERTNLIEFAHRQLMGETFEKGGHYITVWAPRQRGKTWIMQNLYWQLKADERVDVIYLSLQSLQMTTDVDTCVRDIAQHIQELLGLTGPNIDTLQNLPRLFKADVLAKPLILILDEFDSLPAEAIRGLVAVFRNVYLQRKSIGYRLHGVALIGVRAALGVENVSGSPFNVQRSIHIPNLTYEEVDSMFHWYERESGQTVNQDVIDRVFYEVEGQPGLTSWLGELLTETYNKATDQPITMKQFDYVYLRALDLLPNNNILNIISKAKQEPYKTTVLKLFDTNNVLKFAYDDPHTNFLYLNGVIDNVEIDELLYIRVPCPFVQKRLFNYFARESFGTTGPLHDPFDDLTDTITETSIIVGSLLKRYEVYLAKNRHWLFRDAPRRKEDLRIYEAMYHFNFYLFLAQFFQHYPVRVTPEFPTGNGKIDILIDYEGQQYGLEIKSFGGQRAYQKGLSQAARYAHSLGLAEIWLVLFIEVVDSQNRAKFEVTFTDPQTGVQVHPQFVQLGIDEQALS